MMEIPALVGAGLPLDETVDGKLGIVDGASGKIYVEPDEDTLNEMRERQQEEAEKKELLQRLKGRENVTLDGQKVMLYANIGNIKDLAMVMQNDAEGIGLFGVSSFIWRRRIILTKKSSSRSISRRRRRWQVKESSSVRWISVRISSAVILTWSMKRIRRLGTGQSVSA